MTLAERVHIDLLKMRQEHYAKFGGGHPNIEIFMSRDFRQRLTAEVAAACALFDMGDHSKPETFEGFPVFIFSPKGGEGPEYRVHLVAEST